MTHHHALQTSNVQKDKQRMCVIICTAEPSKDKLICTKYDAKKFKKCRSEIPSIQNDLYGRIQCLLCSSAHGL